MTTASLSFALVVVCASFSLLWFVADPPASPAAAEEDGCTGAAGGCRAVETGAVGGSKAGSSSSGSARTDRALGVSPFRGVVFGTEGIVGNFRGAGGLLQPREGGLMLAVGWERDAIKP